MEKFLIAILEARDLQSCEVHVKDLWNLIRKNLKDLGLTDNEIKHITIKLQLHSIDLNKKIYHKN